MRRRHGITLIELMVAVTLGAILLLVMTIQFVANQKFQAVIGDKIAATQEAEVAMYNITQILKFVSPSTVLIDKDSAYAHSIQATLKASFLPDIGSDKSIEYGFSQNNDNNLYYIPDATDPEPVIITGSIIAFGPPQGLQMWDPVTNNFNISLSAQKNNSTVTLTTAIHALPD